MSQQVLEVAYRRPGVPYHSLLSLGEPCLSGPILMASYYAVFTRQKLHDSLLSSFLNVAKKTIFASSYFFSVVVHVFVSAITTLDRLSELWEAEKQRDTDPSLSHTFCWHRYPVHA